MTTDSVAALSELESAYRDRARRMRTLAESGAPVIGYVGSDVPPEVLEAAGAAAYQLHGDPEVSNTAAMEMLGSSVDSWAPSVLSLLLDRSYGPLTAVVLGRDCQSSMYLFYALRELRRLEPELAIPRVHLLDILHLPTPHTLAYNTARLTELDREVLPLWLTGGPASADELGTAIGQRRRIRGLLRQVDDLRRRREPRLTGTQALRVHGAVRSLPPGDALDLLEALTSDVDGLPVVTPTIRLFVTGSNHDTDVAYVGLEADGALVVGEDHDWGIAGGYDVESDDIGGLALALRDRGPAAPSGTMARRAANTAAAAAECAADHVVAYVRRGDEAPSWDYPAQRARLAEVGIGSTLLAQQSYRPDEAQLRQVVAAAREDVSVGSGR